MTDPHAPILSHPFDLARLADAASGDPPHDIAITATAAQCRALADDFGIIAITALSGAVRLRRGADGLIYATLDLKARVTQACIVTTDPVEQRITERASLLLLTAAQAEARNLDHAPIDPDAPDEIVAAGTMVDLGASLTEQLALALDPYPRKADAAIPDDVAPKRDNPFSALAQLRGITDQAGGGTPSDD